VFRTRRAAYPIRVWEGGEGKSYWRVSMEGKKNAPTYRANVVIRPRPDINHLRVPLSTLGNEIFRKVATALSTHGDPRRPSDSYCIYYILYITQ